MDAGSSHTSLFVFKWPSHKLRGTGIVEQVLKCPSKSQSGSLYTVITVLLLSVVAFLDDSCGCLVKVMDFISNRT